MTVAPLRKLVPERFVIETVEVLAPVFGVMLVIVGPVEGTVTVNPFARIPARPLVLLMTTLYWPAILFVRLNEQVIFVGETTVTLVPAISAYPVRFIFTVAPAAKFVPERFVIETVVVLTPVFGAIPLIVGVDDGAVTLI